MAVKFSELPAAASAQTSDVFAIADSGTSRKLTAAQLLTLIAAENPMLGTSSLPPNNDLNDPTESGVYHTDASTLNAPGSNRMVLHMQRGSDRAAQFSIAAAATEQLEIQFRELSGDGWSSWTVLVDDGVIPDDRLSAAVTSSLALADTAIQSGDLATVATSGNASDLTGTLSDARLSAAVTASLSLADTSVQMSGLAVVMGALAQVAGQINGGQIELRGGSLDDPSLRLGTAGVYSSATDTLSVKIGDNEAVRFASTGITELPSMQIVEQSSDPADPAEGQAVLWMSDGTDSGEHGDILVKITAGGTTKTVALVDFSAV